MWYHSSILYVEVWDTIQGIMVCYYTTKYPVRVACIRVARDFSSFQMLGVHLQNPHCWLCAVLVRRQACIISISYRYHIYRGIAGKASRRIRNAFESGMRSMVPSTVYYGPANDTLFETFLLIKHQYVREDIRCTWYHIFYEVEPLYVLLWYHIVKTTDCCCLLLRLVGLVVLLALCCLGVCTYRAYSNSRIAVQL